MQIPFFRVHLLFQCLGKEVEDCTSSYPVGRWTRVSPRSANGQILSCEWNHPIRTTWECNVYNSTI